MKAYKKYLGIINDSNGIDSEIIIKTEKGSFTVSEIMSASQYQYKKLNNNKNDGFEWAISPFLFSHTINKLVIRKKIISNHRKAINKISKIHFKNYSYIDYVDNYNKFADGVSVWDTNWDGSHSINLKHFDYVDIQYDKYTKIEGYYFFPEKGLVEGYRMIVLDEKGFNYLMFGRLNHEQRIARDFIDFTNKTFEEENIKTRYSLSSYFEKMLRGNFGSVDFSNNNFENTQADALIHTENGDFSCNAHFDGFERSNLMQDIIASAYNN